MRGGIARELILVNEIINYFWQVLQKKVDLLEITFFKIVPLHLTLLQLKPSLK